MRSVIVSLLVAAALFGDETDALLEGFEDTPAMEQAQESDALLEGFDDTESVTAERVQKSILQRYGIEGSVTQSAAYSYRNDAPHDGLSSLKSSLFLEYNRAFDNGFKLKLNGNAFYDFAYVLKGRGDFTEEDIDALESEVELFDAYIQGSLSERLDIKAGRQVVVWGKSDTIRVTDILNPLDNRLPGMVDIEDLRLPVTMLKFDYYHTKWRLSPILILEQRFNKNPPFGGDFNPSPQKPPVQKKPGGCTYALNIAGEFPGFDIDFYLAKIYPQEELGLPLVKRDRKITMAGTAFNYVYGSWLVKGELAYKRDFRFLQTGDRRYNRLDTLLGVEYSGIADTRLSYDIARKHIDQSSAFFEKDTWQHALRATGDFLNATLHGNYLIALFGKSMDKGGFQRAWFKYDISDGLSTNFGLVDYLGGSRLFDAISDNDMLFVDVTYSF